MNYALHLTFITQPLQHHWPERLQGAGWTDPLERHLECELCRHIHDAGRRVPAGGNRTAPGAEPDGTVGLSLSRGPVRSKPAKGCEGLNFRIAEDAGAISKPFGVDRG